MMRTTQDRNTLSSVLTVFGPVQQCLLRHLLQAPCLHQLDKKLQTTFDDQGRPYYCRWSPQDSCSLRLTEFDVWVCVKDIREDARYTVTLEDLCTLQRLRSCCKDLAEALPQMVVQHDLLANLSYFRHEQIDLRGTGEVRREELRQLQMLAMHECTWLCEDEATQLLEETERLTTDEASISTLCAKAKGRQLFYYQSNPEKWMRACMLPVDMLCVGSGITVKTWTSNVGVYENTKTAVGREIGPMELATTERGVLAVCANGVVVFTPSESARGTKATRCDKEDSSTRFGFIDYKLCDDLVDWFEKESKECDFASCVTGGMCEVRCGTVMQNHVVAQLAAQFGTPDGKHSYWTKVIGDMIACECEEHFVSQAVARKDYTCYKQSGTTLGDALRRTVCKRTLHIQGLPQMRRHWNVRALEEQERRVEEGLMWANLLGEETAEDNDNHEFLNACELAGCVSVAARSVAQLRKGNKQKVTWDNTTIVSVQWHSVGCDTWKMYRSILKKETYDEAVKSGSYEPDPGNTKPWAHMHTAAGIARQVTATAETKWMRLGKTPEQRQNAWNTVWRQARYFARQFNVIDCCLKIGEAPYETCIAETIDDRREHALKVLAKRREYNRECVEKRIRGQNLLVSIQKRCVLGRELVQEATAPPPLILQISDSDVHGNRKVVYYCTSHVDGGLCSYEGCGDFDKLAVYIEYVLVITQILVWRLQQARTRDGHVVTEREREEIVAEAQQKANENGKVFMHMRAESVRVLRDAVVSIFAHAEAGKIE